MTKKSSVFWLILILIGISLFAVVWACRKQHVEKHQQAQLAAVQQETERQLQELEELQFRVRETTEHNQTWWRTREFLDQARAERAIWQQRWEEGGKKDGSKEQQMVLVLEKRIELLKPFLEP